MQKSGCRTMQRDILLSLHLNVSLHMCRVTPTSWAKTVLQERTSCCQTDASHSSHRAFKFPPATVEKPLRILGAFIRDPHGPHRKVELSSPGINTILDLP